MFFSIWMNFYAMLLNEADKSYNTIKQKLTQNDIGLPVTGFEPEFFNTSSLLTAVMYWQ